MTSVGKFYFASEEFPSTTQNELLWSRLNYTIVLFFCQQGVY